MISDGETGWRNPARGKTTAMSMIGRRPAGGRGKAGGWLAIGWAVLCGAISAPGQGLQIPFYGQRVAHVLYGYSNPAALAVELRVQRPGGTEWTTLATGGTSIGGQRRDDDLDAGTHTYEIRQLVRVPDPEHPGQTLEEWQNLGGAAVELDGRKLNGTLLYDETVSATGTVMNGVTVPADFTLTIEDAVVAKGSPSAYIDVYGNITIGSAVHVEPAILLWGHAYHFTAPGQVNLAFVSGTGGSSITGGTHLNATFYHGDFTLADCTADVRVTVSMSSVALDGIRGVTLIPECGELTLTGSSNVWLELASTTGAIAIADSAIHFSGTSQPNRTGNLFDFENVVWDGAPLRLSRAMDARRCDFQSGLTIVNTTLKADDCAFGGLLDLQKAATGTKLQRCFLRGGAAIHAGAPEFTDCEFAGVVGLYNRTEAKISGNILLDKIYIANDEYAYPPMWHAAATPSPTIENNSFLGAEAFEVQFGMPELLAPIAIGANYYGDPSGLRHGYPENEFLGWGMTHEGAWVVGNNAGRFQFAAPQATGATTRQDKKTFPKFWVNGWIAGQNAVVHHGNGGGAPMMVGRDTLVSVELLTSDTAVQNVRVYAEYNGGRHEAKFTGPLSRDLVASRAHRVWQGLGRTFDVVLPGHSASSMPLEVYADLSGIGGGFDEAVVPTNPVLLVSTTLNFGLPRPARDFTLSVVPVKVSGLLFAKGPPAVGAVAQALRKQLPAMFPIPAERVQVRVDPPVTVYSSADWVSALPLMYKIAAALAGRDAVCGAFLGNPEYVAPDFTVAVLPEGSLHVFFGWGKADGANTKLFRNIVLVDEIKPLAVIHELGHAMGQYLDKEQYDQYPPTGRRLEAVTAFWTEGTPDGMFQAFHRALHFPGSWYNWYEDFDWYDVMGNADDTIWPIPATVNAFQGWFQANLYGAKARAAAPRARRSEPPAGFRRILLTGQTTNLVGTVQHALIAPSLEIFDLTGQNFAQIPPPSNGIWQSLFNFRAYDGATAQVSSAEFYVPTSFDRTQEWIGTFDVPNAARILAIEQDDWMFGNKTTAAWRARGAITNRILEPAAGATVGNELRLTWQGTCGDAAWSSNLAHLVLFSTNGGATWLNPTLPQKGTQLVAQTEFLPRCSDLAIRLVTSDGFTNYASTVSGLAVSGRAPRPEILEPREGDVSITGAVWRLSAQATDYDGDGAPPGIWSSSVQGVLATNDFVQGVLSQGVHVLRYVARAAAGLAATASVQVTVSPTVSSINLGIESNALQVLSRRSDPVSPSPANLLAVGSTNRLVVRYRVPAVPGSVRGTLQVRDPGGASVLLRRQTNAFAEAGWISLAADFVPAAQGEYEIAAALDQIAPADSAAADNARTWRIGTRKPQVTPVPRFAQLEYVLGPAENPAPGQTYWNNVRITCHNTGLDTLWITNAVLTGPNAANCYISTNAATNVPIAPTSSAHLVVWCGATNRGAFRSTLELRSNDPDQPVAKVDFLMMLYNAYTQADTDGDGIYDSTEAEMGTRADLSDTDGDGLSDAQEDANRNGIVDPGETSPLRTDTDGDGIPDGQEDANRDGAWGYGETDARAADSDGDGMPDGAEPIAGTDPLDGDSFLGFASFLHSRTGGTSVVQWKSVSGKTYGVWRSSNLVAGFTHVVATNVAGTAPLNVVTDAAAAGPGPWLYQIRVK